MSIDNYGLIFASGPRVLAWLPRMEKPFRIGKVENTGYDGHVLAVEVIDGVVHHSTVSGRLVRTISNDGVLWGRSQLSFLHVNGMTNIEGQMYALGQYQHLAGHIIKVGGADGPKTITGVDTSDSSGGKLVSLVNDGVSLYTGNEKHILRCSYNDKGEMVNRILKEGHGSRDVPYHLIGLVGDGIDVFGVYQEDTTVEVVDVKRDRVIQRYTNIGQSLRMAALAGDELVLGGADGLFYSFSLRKNYSPERISDTLKFETNNDPNESSPTPRNPIIAVPVDQLGPIVANLATIEQLKGLKGLQAN